MEKNAPSWRSDPRRIMLGVAVACQLATLVITWPLWQVRDAPPNLPYFDGLPQLSFGWLLVATLVGAMIRPRAGVPAHCLLLAIACVFDQFRLEPQLIGLAVLMIGCVGVRGTRFCRWYLVAMWTWAGIHKLLSADWLGHTTWSLLKQAGADPEHLYFPLAVIVAVSEIMLGVLGWLRPAWAARLCVPLHLGIVIFMSPFLAGMNESVIPWNLGVAIVGYWLLTETSKAERRRLKEIPRWELAIASALMIVPVGFYWGWTDRCLAHVLYSDNLPRGLITSQAGTTKVSGWGELEVPFPNERRLHRLYFELTAQPGDKLHVYDPRRALPDQYFLKQATNTIEIDADEFFQVRSDQVAGIGLDAKRSVFALARAGVTMLREKEGAMVYAVAFTPEDFDRRLLPSLSRLPNLQQIQFANTDIRDADLQQLRSLRLLNGLGLSHTKVTDVGLKTLDSLPYLEYVETEGTTITTYRVGP